MSIQPLFPEFFDDVLLDSIADALEQRGYVSLPALLPPTLAEALFSRCLGLDGEDLRRAGIGREQDFQLNRFVRTDRIRWLQRSEPVEAEYLRWMEQLRLGLNRRLFLGLFDYECHFARYGRGDYYKRHVDAFRGGSNRVLSTVLYLNPGWSTADGGELLLYEGDSCEPLERLLPLFGSAVIFLSERFPHEVLPAGRERHSIAGWFRVNGSLGDAIDPPR